VLIRVKTVGVCGSDIHYYTTGRIGDQIVEFPFIVGHEAAGVVEGIGPKVTRVKPRQRIAIDPAVSCGECDQCKSGREHTCRKLVFLGCPGQLAGALCEYVVLPHRNCFPIPDGMTYDQAALAEPLAIALHSTKRCPVPRGANVAILGAGPIGMAIFHVLRTHPVGNVYVTDRIDERLAFARHLHPAWLGNPDRLDVVQEVSRIEPLLLDIVYECSGDGGALAQAVQLLKPGGVLVLVGIPETDRISLAIHELRRKELTIVNVRRQLRCTQEAIDLLSTKRVTMDAMATHHFDLGDTQKAFDLVEQYQDGVMKAMISIP